MFAFSTQIIFKSLPQCLASKAAPVPAIPPPTTSTSQSFVVGEDITISGQSGVICKDDGLTCANMGNLNGTFAITSVDVTTAGTTVGFTADKKVGVKKEIETEEDAYERAAEEIENKSQNKGMWAKAFADADGDEQKQKALYLKYRAKQLSDQSEQ